MAKINKKIMAFTGSREATELVDMLSEYTDNVYAAVASEYGEAPDPGGNITLLSKYMDRENIVSWIDRVGIDIIIDGVAVSREELRDEIKSVCEVKGVEYIRLSENLKLSLNTSICRSVEDLARNMEYEVGSVLICADIQLYEALARIMNSESGRRRSIDNLMIMLPPSPELLGRGLSAGYSRKNIICMDRKLHADFILAMFEEFNVTNFVIAGADKQGMKEKLEAADRSGVRLSIFGDIESGGGMDVKSVWNMLADRFGIEEQI